LRIVELNTMMQLLTAPELADKSVVLAGGWMNSDASYQRIKNRPPKFEFVHRSKVVAALSIVDYVVQIHENTLCQAIKTIRPAHFTKGPDYLGQAFPEMYTARSVGCKIAIIGNDKIASSSSIQL